MKNLSGDSKEQELIHTGRNALKLVLKMWQRQKEHVQSC